MVETTSHVSPAAAGGRLKYADPRDLPSYPSSGLRPDGAAAGAAASLGWSNQKTIEPWRPDKTSASSAAAALAKNYKMAPAWEPASDSAGRQAALLAVGSASAALKQPASSPPKPDSPTAGWGNSAATQAFAASRTSVTQRPETVSGSSSAATQAFNMSRTLSMRKNDTPPPPSPHGDRSLAAAKGAMSLNRPRATSTPSAPTLKPSVSDQTSTANALSGATMAHRASMTPAPVGNAGAVPVTTMTRNMFTSNPPVKPEVAEQENNDKIHASAVAMARKMYAHQQRVVDQTKDAHEGGATPGSGQFTNLQDAAYRQAQERLSKLQDDHYKNREYQEYYGGGSQAQVPKRRFSMAARLRRKTSDDDDEFDDREESQKIRQQMSMFSSKISQIDEGKRQRDRDAVLAAAQRNVKARLQGMDEKVYRDTGKANPSLVSDWEAKAQAAALTRHESRTANKGKIDIGGGRFMDPDEIDAIASARVQPVLNDINEKAEAERERRLALKAEEEARKEEEQRRRAREKEVEQLNQQAKAEEREQLKAVRDQEKAEERERKDAAKAKKAEEKRLAKEEKRKSKHHVPAEAAAEANEATEEDPDAEAVVPGTATVVTAGDSATPAVDTSDATPSGSPTSPTSPTSKVKGWIKNRFSRGKSMSEHPDSSSSASKRRSFFGGAALRDAESGSHHNGSVTSLDNRASSMRDVAFAGKASSPALAAEPAAEEDSHGVSPASTPGEELCDPLAEAAPTPMTPPKPIADPMVRTSVSPSRDSRFKEEIS